MFVFKATIYNTHKNVNLLKNAIFEFCFINLFKGIKKYTGYGTRIYILDVELETKEYKVTPKHLVL